MAARMILTICGARDVLFALALETPGGLKIQTIHSFCQYLLSRFPLEAGIPPGFRVLDDQTARELIGDARTRVLERAGSGDVQLAAAAAHLVTQTSESPHAADPRRCTGQRPRQTGALLRRSEWRRAAPSPAPRGKPMARASATHYERIATDFHTQVMTEEKHLLAVAAWLSEGTARAMSSVREELSQASA